jgi:hypothetical protein
MTKDIEFKIPMIVSEGYLKNHNITIYEYQRLVEDIIARYAYDDYFNFDLLKE